MGVNTKETIIETALRLFNERGSTNVSTKQIAAEMGISPGNLYYHFGNKEEIIRSIYDRVSAETDVLFFDHPDGIMEKGIAQFYPKLISLQKQYRFFYREISILVRNDPALRQAYQRRSVRLMTQFAHTFSRWVELGIMKPFKSQEELDLLAVNAWTLGQLWLTHADILYDSVLSDVTGPEIARIHALLRPYFTSRANSRLTRLLGQK